MDDLNVKLDIFEGPLDLLLHLIKTLEIDIYDIPIADITDQYLTYIHSMKVLDLEVAGDYIVMAATLMSIKSSMLLPKMAVSEDYDVILDEEDPRDELMRQLLEYQTYKQAAEVLRVKESERGKYYTKDATDLTEYANEHVPLEPNEITTIDLFLAIHQVINRQKNLEPLETNIIREAFTVKEKVVFIREQVRLINSNEGLRFDDLFVYYTRNEIVTTFMALLELMKTGEIIARQSCPENPINIYQNKTLEDMK